MVTTKRPARRISLVQDLKMIRRGIRMGTCSTGDQAQRLYELFPDNLLMTDRTHYHNQGYWRNPDDTLDDACEALALLLAEHAGFAAGDRVLDAGFGEGDQDFLWLETYRLAKIVGLNVTPRQAQSAQKRARERGLSDQIDFRIGSATEIDQPAGSFDRVVALESAFHFLTRERFFKESYRILRPGGVLAAADVIPLTDDDASSSRKTGLFTYAYPVENRYAAGKYESLLRSAGFTNVRLTSIRENVFAHWIAYMARKMEDPDFQATISRLTHRWLRRAMTDTARMTEDVSGLDYVIAVAEKPGGP
jgi:erythromycin 3''-O-methyltransferase